MHSHCPQNSPHTTAHTAKHTACLPDRKYSISNLTLHALQPSARLWFPNYLRLIVILLPEFCSVLYGCAARYLERKYPSRLHNVIPLLGKNLGMSNDKHCVQTIILVPSPSNAIRHGPFIWHIQYNYEKKKKKLQLFIVHQLHVSEHLAHWDKKNMPNNALDGSTDIWH